jgi:hypothetical protein
MASYDGGGSGGRWQGACWLEESELGDGHVRRSVGEPPDTGGGGGESCAGGGARSSWGTTSSAKAMNAEDLQWRTTTPPADARTVASGRGTGVQPSDVTMLMSSLADSIWVEKGRRKRTQVPHVIA